MKNSKPLTPAMWDALDNLCRHQFAMGSRTMRALLSRGLIRQTEEYGQVFILTADGYEALGKHETAQMLRENA
jgi:predicted transcriptional regulator